MASRIINSPGVQINEIDESAIQANVFGTKVFITGFANKGPTDEIISVSSLPEFEQIYGTPTNAAERYFYYSVRPLFNTGASIMVNRLPYGADSGDGFGSQYSAVVYPVVAVSGNPTNMIDPVSGTALSTLTATGVDAFVLGKPKHFTLTKAQYLSCVNGQAFKWTANVCNTSGALSANAIASISDFGNAGLIIFNDAQTTINNRYEGYYVGIIDNSNANPATEYTGIATAYTVNTQSTGNAADALTTIPAARFNFALSGTAASIGSISQTLENAASFNIGQNLFNDHIVLGVFKLRPSIYSADATKLDYVLEERYVSSLDYYRQRATVNGGPLVSAYLETDVNNSSRNIKVMVNDYISNRTNDATWMGDNSVPTKSIRLLSTELHQQLNNTTTFSQVSGTIGISRGAYDAAKTALSYNHSGDADALIAIGAYTNPTSDNKLIGSIKNKVTRTLQMLDNDELFDIDITVEAGLGTIYSTLCASNTTAYDDTLVNSNLETALSCLQTTLNYVAPTDSTKDLRGNYNTIFSLFADFARTRMDHIFIADPIRHILVTGDNTKTLSDSSKNWSQHVFSPLRHQFELANTSYAAVYANWARVNDEYTQTNVWVPFSGIVAAEYAKSDRDFAYWSAPAGFRRGAITVADDIAISPNQKQRDDLYKFNLNPIAQFVRDGIVVFGQKTMQRVPSAFDRVNVRRLFIILEKQTKAIARYYVFEPNTLYTRTRVVDDLTPLFEKAKASNIDQGIYDYLLVCDERNNTPAVIDANELVVDIYIKPVRTAEFILVNFYATRTSTNFQEILR